MATDRRTYQREYQREYRAMYPERGVAATRRWKAKKGTAVVALASNHGLSHDEAKAALDARPTACDICSRTAKLYYDHDHTTREHRGWLCNRCNVALGLVDDDRLLAAALKYLEAQR